MAQTLENDRIADFIALPSEEQHKVLSTANADYRALPPQEQQKVIQSIHSGGLEIASLFEQGAIKEDQPEYSRAQKIYMNTKQFTKPIAEAGALTAGGIIGAVPTGPAAPVGAIVGAGLAYGGMDKFFDFLDSSMGLRKSEGVAKELTRTGKTIVKGAEYEMGGQAAGKVIGKAYSMLPEGIRHPIRTLSSKTALTQRGAQKLAYERFVSESKGAPGTEAQIAKNIESAKVLEEKIPGLKFTQGQLTNDASAISLERTLARKSGQDLSQAQREYANEALRKFYANKVSGAGRVEDLTAHTEKLSQQLQSASKEAEDAVQSEVMRLSRNLDEQAVGGNILSKLSTLKQAAKGNVNALFERIPNLKVNPTPLTEKISAVQKEILPGEPAEDIPTEAIKLINRHINPTGKAMQDINIATARGLNRTLNNMIQKAENRLQPNKVLSRRLMILKEGIDEAYDFTASQGGQEGIDILRSANAARRELGVKFEQGTVADVLRKGPRGEATRVAMANIAKEFNSLDGIDDFIRATGDKATVSAAMKDYFSLDLLNSARDPSTGKLVSTKANQWMARNSMKLNKLGLLDEFKNTASLQSNVDKVAQLRDVFNKSVAGRIMEADTDTVISSAFRGSKNYGQTANELLAMVKGNKEAEIGLKKAMSDHMIKQSETTAVDFFQKGGETLSEVEFTRSLAKLTNQIRKYSPALNVIYRNEPEKLKALNDVWRAYNILGRTAKSPMGGGSDLFELLGKSLDITAGSVAPRAWYTYKTLRDMANRFGRENVELYLRKAMFDPDYAETLRSLSKGVTPDKLEHIHRLMTIGIAAQESGGNESKTVNGK